MPSKLPEHPEAFRRKYPKVWRAFAALADTCHESGPLDERSRFRAPLAASYDLPAPNG